MPAIPAIIIAGSAIAGSAISARSQNRSSRNQRDAAMNADRIQDEANRRAEQLQREQMDYDRWLQSATSAARQPYMDMAAGVGFEEPESYGAPGQFTAPTQASAMDDAGYQFALGEGNKQIERSASARGTLLTGGTGKDLIGFGQQAASQQYDKVYNRALNAFTLAETLRGQQYDRNLGAMNARNNAAANTRSGYLSLAQLASPGQYPGYSGPVYHQPHDPWQRAPWAPVPPERVEGRQGTPFEGRDMNNLDLSRDDYRIGGSY